MPRRLLATIMVPVAGLALTVAGTLGAAAQPTPSVQTVWERFIEICPTVAAADDPIAETISFDQAEGGFARSADNLVRAATLTLTDLESHGNPAILFVSVDDFEGGRMIDCTMQLLGEGTDDLDGLVDLIRDEAARALGEEAVLDVAGGPLAALTRDGGPAPSLEVHQAVRIATAGFPPEATLSVRVLPDFATLDLRVIQARPNG